MERKLFECSKQGIKQLEQEYPDCKQILTILQGEKLFITNGDNLTQEEKEKYNVQVNTK